jgi:rhodanese-related sulfurtransferase
MNPSQVIYLMVWVGSRISVIILAGEGSMVARIFAIIIMLSLNVSSVFASEIISAPKALEKIQSGELVLIDIRSPAEWKESGIAEPAIPISMHEAGFLEGLEKVRAENPGKQIALICATGGRSAHIQSELEKRNLGSVIDLSEGMFGNGRGAGWLKRGLPIKQFQ